MLLAIDVGNTNTVFAIFEKNKKLAQWRCSTSEERTADEYFVWLKSLMDLNKFNLKKIDGMIFSSVVPKVGFNLRILSDRYFKCKPLAVGKDGCKLPIKVKVDEGTNVGSDRIVNTAGAFDLYKGNLIIIDFGTATTFDIVRKGKYVGGVIAPGVKSSIKNLSQSTALLPLFDLKYNQKSYGKNTKDALNAGFVWGYEGLINNIINKITLKWKNNYKIILTGGYANLFKKIIKRKTIIDQNITIKGVSRVYRELL